MKFNTALLFSLAMLTRVCAQDIKPAKIKALMEVGMKTRSNAIIIFKDNKLINETYFDTVKAGTKIETMSCTKSIVSLGIACLQADGLIDSLDVPVCKYYPEWKQGNKQLVTLRHLLNMTSGIQNNPNATVEIYPSKNFVQLALCAELSNKPGEKWEYNNKALNLLAGIVKQISGKRMDIYINERLFKPLGIKDYAWSLDDSGNPHVMSGCQLAPIDFIKLGLLLINKGNANGAQIIPAKFIDDLIVPCNRYDGYGKLWWIDYEYEEYVVDDEIINAMIAGGVSNDFMDKIKRLKGVYKTEAFGAKLIDVFGQDYRQAIRSVTDPKRLSFFKRTSKGAITYRADGYLGNFIIVNPKDKIVAVRMISSDRSDGEHTGFENFKNLVLDLTQ